LIDSGDRYRRISEIAGRIIDAAREYRPDSASWAWEIIYVDENIQNAHCLPGGKITIYSGLIDTLSLSDDEVASIIGHEVAHALREHGREKRSKAQVAQVAVGVLAIAAGIAGYKHKIDPALVMNTTRLAGGAAASMFFLLPNSREMEIEADAIGVELAARAGYDPAAAQDIWRKMNSSSRVEFMSTHPSSETRIGELTPVVARARDVYGHRLLASTIRHPHSVSTPSASTGAVRIESAVKSETDCELPGGEVETLALLACQRLGGTIRENSR
jgi:predicted Zn-dependent protease